MGQKHGTRELVLSPLPYVVVYSVAVDAVHVYRVMHSAEERT